MQDLSISLGPSLPYIIPFPSHKGSEKCELTDLNWPQCIITLMRGAVSEFWWARGSHLTPFPENKTTAHMASQDWDSSFQYAGEWSGRRGPWWEALCTWLTFSLSTSLWRSFQFLETGFGAELHNISIYLLVMFNNAAQHFCIERFLFFWIIASKQVLRSEISGQRVGTFSGSSYMLSSCLNTKMDCFIISVTIPTESVLRNCSERLPVFILAR